jgi:LCP family protein required for cell wall assembly
MKLIVRVFCLTVLCGLLLGALLWKSPLYQVDAEGEEPTVDVDTVAGERITRFLVMGCDRAARLTDSIFVVTLNETQAKASILQIPRDTYANYTDRDYRKLNGAMQVLGEQGVKEALGKALGVRLDYFVVLDLDCLSRVVDVIGGVDVEIPQDMTYTDPAQDLNIDLGKGLAHLDGKHAEEFVRYRSGYANADLGRLDAQKLFLRAFAKKCQSLTAGQFLQLTCSVITDLRTDIGLPQAIRVASVLLKCNADDLPMQTLAGEAAQGKSGAWYYCVNRVGGCEMANAYLMPPATINVADFDKDGFFDRADYPDFHKIYTAPYGANQ